MRFLKFLAALVVFIIVLPLWCYFFVLMSGKLFFGSIPQDMAGFFGAGLQQVLRLSKPSLVSHFLFLPLLMLGVSIVLYLLIGRLRALFVWNGIAWFAAGMLISMTGSILLLIKDTPSLDRQIVHLTATVPKEFTGSAAEIANGLFLAGIILGIVVCVAGIILIITGSILHARYRRRRHVVVGSLLMTDSTRGESMENEQEEKDSVIEDSDKGNKKPVDLSGEEKKRENGKKGYAELRQKPTLIKEKKIIPGKITDNKINNKKGNTGLRIFLALSASILTGGLTLISTGGESIILALWLFTLPLLFLILRRPLAGLIKPLTGIISRIPRPLLILGSLFVPLLTALLFLVLSGGRARFSLLLTTLTGLPLAYIMSSGVSGKKGRTK